MIDVRIFKDWKYPDPLRQTPGGKGEWRGVRFHVDEPGEADYVIIHRRVETPTEVVCPPENVWLALGEPPCEVHRTWAIAPRWVRRVYNSDATMISPRHLATFPLLTWHVDSSIDFLQHCPPPEKTRQLSWITSDKSGTNGHARRLRFINLIKDMPELNLLGRGFVPIKDKWDGLAPYRYSIAFENYSNQHYWTEKVMDCFLAWTMPIYFGCTRLSHHFPQESFIQMDPDMPDPQAWIRQVIRSDHRERNLAAIAEARRLVLQKYNMFEFLTSEIEQNEIVSPAHALRRRRIVLENHTRGNMWLRSNTPASMRRVFRAVAGRFRGIMKSV